MLEENAPVLISARLEAEERRTNIRLREEQDAAYRAALEADQVRTICDLVVLLGHSFDTCFLLSMLLLILFYTNWMSCPCLLTVFLLFKSVLLYCVDLYNKCYYLKHTEAYILCIISLPSHSKFWICPYCGLG